MMQSPPHEPEIPFAKGFSLAVAHGIVSSCSLPATPIEPPREILNLLCAEERSFASRLSGHTLMSFIGGRLALHESIARLKVRSHPILPDIDGVPVSPPGLAVSISHKRDLAVGLATCTRHWRVGVDIEDMAPDRAHIAEKILTESERELVDRLMPDRRWLTILLIFSLKESIYKAIFPYLRRYVGFQELSLEPRPDGGASVYLHAPEDRERLFIEAGYHWLPGRVLCTARARER